MSHILNHFSSFTPQGGHSMDDGGFHPWIGAYQFQALYKHLQVLYLAQGYLSNALKAPSPTAMFSVGLKP